jgi:hypothetical protein
MGQNVGVAIWGFTYHLDFADFKQKPKENTETESFVNTSTLKIEQHLIVIELQEQT